MESIFIYGPVCRKVHHLVRPSSQKVSGKNGLAYFGTPSGTKKEVIRFRLSQCDKVNSSLIAEKIKLECLSFQYFF